MVRMLLLSPQFKDPSNYYKRYSWPVEFVVRSLKEVGWNGFSVNSALNPLINMGQQLFEPPDVNGWELGPGWFSSGGMLARMNFAAALATNQRFNLRDQVARQSRLAGQPAVVHARPADAAGVRVRLARGAARLCADGGAWTGSDTQLAAKSSGLAHLISGSGDYQFV